MKFDVILNSGGSYTFESAMATQTEPFKNLQSTSPIQVKDAKGSVWTTRVRNVVAWRQAK